MSQFEPTVWTIRSWILKAQTQGRGRPMKSGASEREELEPLRKENRILREEREILKSCGLVCQGSRLTRIRVFQVMAANQARFSIRRMASVLGVSASGFYAWAGRAPSKRAQHPSRFARGGNPRRA